MDDSEFEKEVTTAEQATTAKAKATAKVVAHDAKAAE